MTEVKRLLGNEFEPIKCPKCKIVAISLVSLTDDGKGQKICVSCKRKHKAKNPKVNYSKVLKCI